MASGVAVNPTCVTAMNDLVKERKHRAVVFAINDDMTEIKLEKTFPPNASSAQAGYDEFTKSLPDDSCRYAVYDFEYEHQGAKKNRIIFVLWSSDLAKVRTKLIYSSSAEGLVSKLGAGVQRQIQVTDRDELSFSEVSKKLVQHTAGY
ncbi:hypothetical protein BU14_0070s0054 [Porphyra umbilicalis]|uniref:ADF-H domain-containing protein n=1 Tax=Porphyra umbilicalis TaxID=2786 RepID=A0A1X6PG98_PORUM|nr:hypothetical protein BU14_0070s0054 [Porphyra umbilicalis]|eukprot:OSX79879.1 hypothetical protein BU14_0070s0054 [Porphyra umbilicalis]